MKPWFPIETVRLRLREFAASDLDNIQEYAADPEVVRFMFWGPNSLDVTRDFLDDRLKEQQRWPRDNVTLAVELRSEQRVIGAVRLGLGGDEGGDLGYVLNRRYWRQGFVTEAVEAVLDTAFRKIGLHRVWARCDARNRASWGVMEKAGMRREGLFLKDKKEKGVWCDSYYYAILDDEWLRR